VPRLAFALLALATLALPAALADPVVPGAISGTAHATTYYVVGGGASWSGGAFTQSFACSGCYVRFTVDTSALTVVQNGAETTLAPGSYQIAGFDGFLGITVNGYRDFFLEIHGAGEIAPWLP